MISVGLVQCYKPVVKHQQSWTFRDRGEGPHPPKKSSPTLFLNSGVLEIDTVQLEQVRKSPSHSWCDPVIKHIRITPRNVDLLKYDNI